MMIHTKYNPKPAANGTAAESSEQYHGDLRKGAYLRRRAAYQMQAGTLAGRNKKRG